MGKDKLKRFKEMQSFPNVFQNFSFKEPSLTNHENKNVELKGQWKALYFKNQNPIVLELACGRGEYTVGLASKYKNNNFIGVDIKGARIYAGAKYALQNDLQNVAFVRTRIELLPHFFSKQEVDEAWIVFADPFLKGNERNRLTSARFLEVHRQICKPNALIHLKTDSLVLFEYTLEVLKSEQIIPNTVEYDVYAHGCSNPDVLGIQTYYEKMHLADGRKIYYLTFNL